MGEVKSFNAERANRTGDNTLITPAECLEDAASEIRSGARECNKVMVITLNTGDNYDTFQVGFYAAQMRSSEMLAALEAIKTTVLRDMGFIE